MGDNSDKESKTEEATDKRREQALEEGNSPLSRELTNVGFVFALMATATWMALQASSQIAGTLMAFIERPNEFRLDNAADVSLLLRATSAELAPVLAPFALLFVLCAVLFQIIQIPISLSFKRIQPKGSRLSIGAGWKRIASMAGLVELAKGLAKLGFLGSVGIYYLVAGQAGLLSSVDTPAQSLPAMIIGACISVLVPVSVGVCVLAAFDIVFSRSSWHRRLRMTRQEVRDEAKQSEGDQAQMHRRRAVARSRLRELAIRSVPRATLVIANPTHYAIALRYVRSEGGSPVVIAKGQDLLALQIRRIAEHNEIPVVEDRALARSLYASVEINQAIPREFFGAVANIISVLRKLGNRHIIKALEV